VFRYYHKAENDADRRSVLSTALLLLASSYSLFATATFVAAPLVSRLVFGSESQSTLIRISAATLGVQSFVIVPLAYLRLQERSVAYTYVTTARLALQVALNILFLAVF